MIENLPEWAKKKFQERLAVVLEYAAAIDRAEKEHRQAGTRFYRRPFTNEFAGAIGRNPGTVYRWLSTYIKEGEEGLIPGYGKNKGKTIIKTHLAHLIDHLIVPSRPDQEIIAEFLKACDAADEKSPVRPPFKRTSRPSGKPKGDHTHRRKSNPGRNCWKKYHTCRRKLKLCVLKISG